MVADLVRRAQSGDAEAYTELVRRFQDAVFATAYQTALDFDAARDIAQETFVRAYEGLARLRDPRSFPAWLVRICRNLSVSWLRRPERAWAPLEVAPPVSEDVAAQVASRDLVTRALSALPSDNRLALSLVLVDGYTYREVAEMTGASLSTVRGRVHRARRQMATEVLGMVEETLQGNAPGEEFTVDTVRESLNRAQQALDAGHRSEATVIARQAWDHLAGLSGQPEELRNLRLQSLVVTYHSLLWTDPAAAVEALRQAMQILETAGEPPNVAFCLSEIARNDPKLTPEERGALEQRAIDLWREAGMHQAVAEALFFRGWHRVDSGDPASGLVLFEESRQALADLPYGDMHGRLEATDEFLRLAGPDMDLEGLMAAQATCDVAQVDGARLVHRSEPGYGWASGDLQDHATFASAFGGLWRVGWFPVTGPGAGHEEESDGFSYTSNPTRRRVWLEATRAPETPAGAFDECLLVRASITESPLDAEDESPQRKRNAYHCGELYCWFARGVGPVAYRFDRADGVRVNVVLSRFGCPESSDARLPLVPGARWEYVPAEPPPNLSGVAVTRLTHRSDTGECYFATTVFGRRSRSC